MVESGTKLVENNRILIGNALSICFVIDAWVKVYVNAFCNLFFEIVLGRNNVRVIEVKSVILSDDMFSKH